MINLNIDPRPDSIAKRLAKVKKIYAVSGFKGGVGKSSVACALALMLAKKGKKVGLLDMDFAGSSCHTVLGAELGPEHFFPEEIEGLLPPLVSGIRFMSMYYFNDGKAVHMRGPEQTNAIIELLAVTNWEELDYLILDMPPGIADTAMDVLRFIPGCEMLCVYTPSVLSRKLLETSLVFIKESGGKIKGLIENMAPQGYNEKPDSYETLAVIPYDPQFESYIGHPDRLLESRMTEVLSAVKEL